MFGHQCSGPRIRVCLPLRCVLLERRAVRCRGQDIITLARSLCDSRHAALRRRSAAQRHQMCRLIHLQIGWASPLGIGRKTLKCSPPQIKFGRPSYPARTLVFRPVPRPQATPVACTPRAPGGKSIARYRRSFPSVSHALSGVRLRGALGNTGGAPCPCDFPRHQPMRCPAFPGAVCRALLQAVLAFDEWHAPHSDQRLCRVALEARKGWPRGGHVFASAEERNHPPPSAHRSHCVFVAAVAPAAKMPSPGSAMRMVAKRWSASLALNIVARSYAQCGALHVDERL